jgi:Cu+-exporting ATPase
MDQNENIIQIGFKVEGMTCSSCSSIVQKKLNSLDGITYANVNIATEKGQVQYDSQKIDIQTIVNAVDNLGYKAILNEERNTQKVTLKVKGMSCTACASQIEKSLNKMEGITSATVNFAAEKTTIQYDPKKVRLIDMQKTISGIGYELDLDEDEDDAVDQDELKMNKAKKIMLTSSLFTGAIMGLMMIHMFVAPIPGYLPIIAALGLPIIFGTGLHVHVGSWKAIKNKSPNMDVLVTLGSLPPYLIGLLGLFFPIQAFIEMATTIMTFHLIGKYLEARAKGRASQAIKKLLQMGAKTAKIIVDGEEIEIPTKDLQVGDIMVIRPGEKGAYRRHHS